MREGGERALRALARLTWVEAKLFVREPVGAFFALVFPLVLLFLVGGIAGNAPDPRFGGRGVVDVLVPAYAALAIATAGLLGLPTVLASYRERGILRRLHASPLGPAEVLAAHGLVMFAMTALGLIVLLVAARSVYGLRFGGSVAGVAAAFTLACAGFFAFGFVVASLVPTTRTAQVVGLALFYPMLAFSGVVIPLGLLPAPAQTAAAFLPLTYVVTFLRGTWTGAGWGAHLGEVGVLAALAVGGLAFAVRTFRWT